MALARQRRRLAMDRTLDLVPGACRSHRIQSHKPFLSRTEVRRRNLPSDLVLQSCEYLVLRYGYRGPAHLVGATTPRQQAIDALRQHNDGIRSQFSSNDLHAWVVLLGPGADVADP